MNPDVRLEVWALPHTGPTAPLYGDITDIIDFSFEATKVGIEEASFTVPANHPYVDDICEPTTQVETIVRVYLGTTQVGAFFAQRRHDTLDDDQPAVVISGPGIDSYLDHAMIPPRDYPLLPTVQPDWEYGVGLEDGTLQNGDMEDVVDPADDPLDGNGGAEDNAIAPFEAFTNNGTATRAPAIFDTSTTEARTGTYSFRCDPQTSYHSGFKVDITGLQAGGRYVLTAYLKEPTASGLRYTAGVRTDGFMYHDNAFRFDGYVMAELDNAARSSAGDGEPGGSADGTWQSFEIDCVVSSSTTTIYFQFDDHLPSGQNGPVFYVDDISFVPYDEPEIQKLPPWEPFHFGTATSVTITPETGTTHGGSTAALVEQTAASSVWGMRQYLKGISIGIYTVNAWVRAASGSGQSVTAILRSADGAGKFGSETVTIDNSAWVEIEFEATIEAVASSTGVANCWLEFRGDTTGLLVDDVTLTLGSTSASIGTIARDLADACKARGFLVPLAVGTFNATEDSNSDTWNPEELPLTVPRGISYGDFLRAASQTFGYEYEVIHVDGDTIRLRLCNPGGIGTTVGETITEGVQIIGGGTEQSVQLATSVFVEGRDGYWQTSVDTSATNALGPREEYSQSGDWWKSSLNRRATQALAVHTKYPEAVRVAFHPEASPVPLVDFAPGDTVNVHLDTLTGEHRVEAISYRWRGDDVRIEGELNDRALTARRTQAKALNALLAERARPAALTAGAPGGGGTPHIYVAAANAPQDWLDNADVVCTGISDETTLNDVISEAIDSGDGRRIYLSPGDFNCAGRIIGGYKIAGFIGAGIGYGAAFAGGYTRINFDYTSGSDAPADFDGMGEVSGIEFRFESGADWSSSDYLVNFQNVHRVADCWAGMESTANPPAVAVVGVGGFDIACSVTNLDVIAGTTSNIPPTLLDVVHSGEQVNVDGLLLQADYGGSGTVAPMITARTAQSLLISNVSINGLGSAGDPPDGLIEITSADEDDIKSIVISNISGVYETGDTAVIYVAGAEEPLGTIAIDTDSVNVYGCTTKVDNTNSWAAVTVSGGGGGGPTSYADLSTLDGNTDATGAEIEELTDGSETTLHSHAGSGGVEILDDGSSVGTRPAINFHEGSNVTLTIADDAGNGEVDVTIAAAGGGGTVTGAGLYLASTTPLTAASGTRTVPFDTQYAEDAGWTASTADNSLTVPADGWYSLMGHVRIDTALFGYHICAIRDADTSTDYVRGSQLSVTALEVDASGVAYLTEDTELILVYYSSVSTQIVGGTAATTTALRAVLLG